jgi:hypothetical protein
MVKCTSLKDKKITQIEDLGYACIDYFKNPLLTNKNSNATMNLIFDRVLPETSP